MANTLVEGSSPLSRDIKLLANLLGQVIVEQHGDDALALEENVRKAARARRNNVPGASDRLKDLIDHTDLHEKLVLVKAFANYFQLTNIAEDQQRVRVLRQRAQNNGLRESIGAALKDIKDAGTTTDEMQQIIAQLRLRLVLTAHPSEAKRKEVLIKLRHITEIMNRLEREELIPDELTTLEGQLSAEIEELWQTEPIRSDNTTVADEVDFGLYFITAVIMDVSVEIYQNMQDMLQHYFPDAAWEPLPQIIQYASWIGGDRDGNPNVTHDATLTTLATLRQHAHQVYLEELVYLRDHLTQSHQVDAVKTTLGIVATPENPILYPSEPYRQFVHQILLRLQGNEYRTGDELHADIQELYDCLVQHDSKRIATTHIRPLLNKIRLFGLHLTPVEVREDAGYHTSAIGELFKRYGLHDDYINADEETKQDLLTVQIASRRPLFPSRIDDLAEVTQRVIQTWRMIAQAHDQYGPVVIDTVIASMSKAPSDVLAMLLLAQEVGVADNIDIAPLFETIDDLYNAPDTMIVLFQHDAYLQHLQIRAARSTNGQLRQQIMIGYSDSSKDGGYLASNHHLYTAQQRLTEVCAEYGVLLQFFHGRGGSIGRGGGPTNRAIRSHPANSIRGGIKITEQGEVIAYRYSNRDIANRHLQQVMNAALLSLNHQTEDTIPKRWSDAMAELSETSRQAYRNFVYESEAFLPYWQQATPINELSELRISSRPAKRKKKGGFAAMRAIPWMFSWMQSRTIIPSWFGIGSALQAFTEAHDDGIGLLREMYRDWIFFRTVIDNAQLDVAKADMGIAELYAALVAEPEVRETMFTRINDEYSRTYHMICEITGQSQLLENFSAIRKSIDQRNPYVDPLNYIQVALLREIRQEAVEPGSDEHRELLEAIFATLNGIAAAMKTTG